MIESQNHLKQVQRDMTVYDCTGKKVGKVSYVHSGTDDFTADWTIDPSSDVAPEVIDELPDGNPDVINERMLHLGFVKIKTGLLSPTRYALAEHIDEISSDEVYLSVVEDQLPT